MIKKLRVVILFLTVLLTVKSVDSQPVVIKGEMLREVCKTPVSSIRLCTSKRESIPFQVDELTFTGNYICDQGDSPNADSANGIIDLQDEIVFLLEDCEVFDSMNVPPDLPGAFYYAVKIKSKPQRVIYVTNDTSVHISSKRYIDYDHNKQYVRTPFFYAQFGRDRFHFIKAGVWNPQTLQYANLTNELAIKIYLRALWGLIPIHYNEDNLICIVTRYKCGPVRLIRGGNFHLNLGMGIKGSNAYVNQICYPQVVRVPVNVHVPIRFRMFFREAFIEMSPVIRNVDSFQLRIPSLNICNVLSDNKRTDTLLLHNPNNDFYSVTDGKIGYGWILQAKIDNKYLNGSGFIIRKPSYRDSLCSECGFRMAIRDLLKGRYEINNWVSFSTGTYSSIVDLSSFIQTPTEILTPWGSWKNLLSSNPLNRQVLEKKH